MLTIISTLHLNMFIEKCHKLLNNYGSFIDNSSSYNSKHLIGFPIHPHCPGLPEGGGEHESVTEPREQHSSTLDPLRGNRAEQIAAQGGSILAPIQKGFY